MLWKRCRLTSIDIDFCLSTRQESNMTATAATSARSAVPNAVPFTLIEDQFVDMTFMTQYTGLTDKWFYKLIQEGKFPRPVKFGRSSRWLKSELEAWIQERIQGSRAA